MTVGDIAWLAYLDRTPGWRWDDAEPLDVRFDEYGNPLDEHIELSLPWRRARNRRQHGGTCEACGGRGTVLGPMSAILTPLAPAILTPLAPAPCFTCRGRG